MGPNTRPAFLLLVGDEACLGWLARQVLETYGFRVVAADSGREAMLLLHAGFRPSALLLDLDLTSFDDVWDLRHMQLSDSALRSIPVVVLSEQVPPAAIRKQFREVQVVRKPIHPATLLAAIARGLTPDQPTSHAV